MPKRKSIKERLAHTAQDSKIETEARLNKLDLNERIKKAEAIVNAGKVKKANHERVIRDAFTMRQADIEAINQIKQKCLKAGITEANKSLIVRAGIQKLAKMPIDELRQLIDKLPKIKVGRPKY